jgi:hypothetical protein
LKRGFGLISALIIMLLISTLLVAVAKFAFVSAKHTSDTYLIQRGELFMQSAIENAILAIEGYERKNGCLEHINFIGPDKKFEANVTVLRYYCYNGDCGCNNPSLVKSIKTPFSHGYVLLKVVVENNSSLFNKKIKLEKITLQRP